MHCKNESDVLIGKTLSMTAYPDMQIASFFTVWLETGNEEEETFTDQF
jgi:hypothetical protein